MHWCICVCPPNRSGRIACSLRFVLLVRELPWGGYCTCSNPLHRSIPNTLCQYYRKHRLPLRLHYIQPPPSDAPRTAPTSWQACPPSSPQTRVRSPNRPLECLVALILRQWPPRTGVSKRAQKSRAHKRPGAAAVAGAALAVCTQGRQACESLSIAVNHLEHGLCFFIRTKTHGGDAVYIRQGFAAGQLVLVGRSE